jgi:AcrR family transcriptional regulator
MQNTRLTRQEQKTQTRERLIDAAAEVFARRGFMAASLDEVAAAAGYTKGAVYSNFSSKTDLFIALIERRIEVESARIASHLDETGGTMPEDGASSDPERELRWVMLAIEFWLYAMRDDRARQAMAGQYERARTMAAGYIETLYRSAGKEPLLPPRDMAIAIEAFSTGLALQWALDPEHVSMDLQTAVLVKALGLPLRLGPVAAPEPAGAPMRAAGRGVRRLRNATSE